MFKFLLALCFPILAVSKEVLTEETKECVPKQSPRRRFREIVRLLIQELRRQQYNDGI